MSCAIALRPLWAAKRVGMAVGSSARLVSAVIPHTPHSGLSSAGPSRCFCTSSHQQKASEMPLALPLDDVQRDSYSTSEHDSSPTFWPAPTNSHAHLRSRFLFPDDLPTYYNQPASEPELPPISQQTAYCHKDFFTSATPKPIAAIKSVDKGKTKEAPLYIHTLDSSTKDAFAASVSVLIRSGERCMSNLLKTMPGELTAEQSEQLACFVMRDCIKQERDARSVWDIYDSWLQASNTANSASVDPGRSAILKFQANTIYQCCYYLQSAGLVRQAAAMAADTRLKPSQARYLVQSLVFHRQLTATIEPRLQAPASLSKAEPSASITPRDWSEACLAVQELSKTMCVLMDRGLLFEQWCLSNILRLLCLSASHDHAVRLHDSAQQRVNFTKSPQVLPTDVMEKMIAFLCSQSSAGGQAAYTIVTSLPTHQRTETMYNSLMRLYSHAHLTSLDQSSTELSNDDKLLHDLMTMPHLGGITVQTISRRILSHTVARRWTFVREDITYLRDTLGATIHDLHPSAQFAILRCGVETGHLQVTFGIACKLLARHSDTANGEDDRQRSADRIVHTLLRSAQRMWAETGKQRLRGKEGALTRTTKSRLLMRFLTHYSHLHLKFPFLVPTLETLVLFVRLLAVHERSIDSRTLWKMVEVICSKFSLDDPRTLPLLIAFARVFRDREDPASHAKMQTLIRHATQNTSQKDTL